MNPLESERMSEPIRPASILQSPTTMRRLRNSSRKLTPVTVVVAILTAATVSFPGPTRADVEVSYDESVNFSYLRKFAWTEGTPPEDESLQRRIEAAIQRELIVKGLRKDDDDPDFFISTHFEGDTVTVEMHQLDSGEVFWRGIGTGAVPEKEKKLEYRINKAAA